MIVPDVSNSTSVPPGPAPQYGPHTMEVPPLQIVALLWIAEALHPVWLALWDCVSSFLCGDCSERLSARWCGGVVDPWRKEGRVHVVWPFVAFIMSVSRVFSYMYLPPAEVAAIQITAAYLLSKMMFKWDMIFLVFLGMVFISELVRSGQPAQSGLVYHRNDQYSTKTMRLLGVFYALVSALCVAILRTELLRPVEERSFAEDREGEAVPLLGRRVVRNRSQYLTRWSVYGFLVFVSGVLNSIFAIPWVWGLRAAVAFLAATVLPATPPLPSPWEAIFVYPLQWVLLRYPFEPISALGAFFLFVAYLFFKENESSLTTKERDDEEALESSFLDSTVAQLAT